MDVGGRVGDHLRRLAEPADSAIQVSSYVYSPLGMTGVDIVTRATVEASPAVAAHCSLPIYLVDRWSERGGDRRRRILAATGDPWGGR